MCWLDSDGHQTVQVFVLNIQESLYKDVARHRSQDDEQGTGQLNHDSRWDNKCIDQNVHMRIFKGIYFPQTRVPYNFKYSVQRGKLT